MFIHIGDNIIVSDKKLVGIFSSETLKLSNENDWILQQVDSDKKTIALDRKNIILSSSVSPFTVIKRTALDEDSVWRKNDVEKL
jgi:hypothetical protein